MTISGILQHVETNTFDERVEVLAHELELAIKWNRPSALLAIYSSEHARVDAEAALKKSLSQHDQSIVHIPLDDMPGFDLGYHLHQMPVNTDQVFFISGVKKPDQEQANVFLNLGTYKDELLDKKIRLVFWVSHNSAADLLRTAPDFWGYRQRIIEFDESPKPDQILQNAIETVWQGIGEYTEQLEDTDEKINMRETLLTELPKDAESTSTRAHLMLTLGILNWRKGDYEKAFENLQNAIKSAIKLEDNLFEAECFNAIALVFFSQGKNDEAIEAYKQAIAIAPEQIFVWNNLGNLCLKIMRNDEAMLAFQKALIHNEKDPVAWNGLGAVYYAIGYISDSIVAYKKAIEFSPALAHPWNGLGDAYVRVGRDLDAIAAYQEAIELKKQYVAPLLGLADVYNRQGRNKDAFKLFQRALNIKPSDHLIWNNLGLVLLKMNLNDEAAQAFIKACELNKNFAWSYCNLAAAYANQSRHTESIDLCLKSLSMFTEDADKAVAWDRLADYYRAVNDYDNAMKAYQTADQLRGRIAAPKKFGSDSPLPDPAPAADSPVEERPAPPEERSAKQQSQTEEAINRLIDQFTTTEQTMEEPDMSAFFSHPILKSTSASEISKKQVHAISFENEDDMTESRNPAVWNEKGNIHFRNGAYNDAVTAYNKAIELDRSFGWPYSNLALTYLTLGKYAEAVLLYQKSICLLQTNEEKAASWNSLGNIYRRLNNYEGALEAYQNADAVDPQNAGKRDKADFAYSVPNSQNPQVWIELGNLFFKAAAYNDAVEAYTKAVKIDPASGWAHSNLAMSLVYQGKYKEAIPVYLKSIELFTSGKDKAVSWNRLGNVYRRMNDSENAKKAYKNAADLSDEKESLLTRARFSLLGNCYSN